MDLSRILNLKYTTAVNRRKTGNYTPDEVECLADYFGRTIAYYFDREEKEVKVEKAPVIPGTTQVSPKPYAQAEQHNIAIEPKITHYTCPECIQKEEKIRDLRDNINDLRKHIELLEFSLGNKNRQSASG
ncbi:MAG TPA: hypothetical protein VFG54_12380 [Prolixibacteraceae bacterium]|nr:hypothetical protein [Prolixibacteraceae bacterium]